MNTMINNGKQIEVARVKWAQRLGSLAKQGYIESCYYAPGVTPQNLLSIVGYNLIEKDGLEKLMVTKSLRNRICDKFHVYPRS